MAGRLTLWGAGEILATMFSKTAEAPNSYYLALVKDLAPTAYVSGSELDEPVGAGYARAEIPNDSYHWGQSGMLQVISNLEPVVFTQATELWGKINYWALCDSPEAGNNLAVGEMTTGLVIRAGDSAAILEGDISFALGPFYAQET